jgi:hypothetical protein
MKACWIVSLPTGQRFPMVGGACSHAEALAYARAIWPAAEVE